MAVEEHEDVIILENDVSHLAEVDVAGTITRGGSSTEVGVEVKDPDVCYGAVA